MQVVGLLLLLAGVGLGFVGLGECGSAFSPDYSQAQINDVLNVGTSEAECRDRVSSMRPLAFGALGLGALTAVIGTAGLLAARASGPTQA